MREGERERERERARSRERERARVRARVRARERNKRKGSAVPKRTIDGSWVGQPSGCWRRTLPPSDLQPCEPAPI